MLAALILVALPFFGNNTKALLKEVDDTQQKINRMCISYSLGPTSCIMALDDITDIRFHAMIAKKLSRREQEIIRDQILKLLNKYGIQ
jgi:hypothetical protein